MPIAQTYYNCTRWYKLFKELSRAGERVEFKAVLEIRIRKIRMFLGLLDPDPLVIGMDPDPSLFSKGVE
jgi:hypothetical protein